MNELSGDDAGDLRAAMSKRVKESDGSSVSSLEGCVERLRNEPSRDPPPRRMNERSGDDAGVLPAAISKRVKESDGSSVPFQEKLARTVEKDVDGEWVADMAS